MISNGESRASILAGIVAGQVALGLWACLSFAILDVRLRAFDLGEPVSWAPVANAASVYVFTTLLLAPVAIAMRWLTRARMQLSANVFGAIFWVSALGFVLFGSWINIRIQAPFASSIAIVTDVALLSAAAACFWFGGQALGRMSARTHTVGIVGLPALAVAIMLLPVSISGWWTSSESADHGAGGGGPNVLVVLIDTLRADHVRSYGYARDTSPRIDALAAGGVRFETAYAQSSWTRPSLASILTSLYPSQHGAQRRYDVLDDRVTTLAELLTEHGYTSRAYMSNSLATAAFGLGQGFESFYVPWSSKSFVEQPYRLMAPQLLSTLTRSDLAHLYSDKANDRLIFERVQCDIAAGLPDRSFLFVHLMAPHSPYGAPEPFGSRYAADSGGTRSNGVVSIDGDLAAIVNGYDGGIRYADWIVGELLDALATVGATDNLLTIVTSDHGEAFDNHGNRGHGNSLYDELIRVPLVWSWPGTIVPDSVVSTPVRSIDIYPTIAALLRLPVPPQAHGIDLSALLRGEPASPEPIFTELRRPRVSLRAVVHEQLKLIVRTGESADGQLPPGPLALFDLANDPNELHDLLAAGVGEALASEHMELLDSIAAHLSKTVFAGPSAVVGKDLQEGLRALGYVQ